MTYNLIYELRDELLKKTYEGKNGVDSSFHDDIKAITGNYEINGISCNIPKEFGLNNVGHAFIELEKNDYIFKKIIIEFSLEYNKNDGGKPSRKLTILNIYEDDSLNHIVSKGNDWKKMITSHWDSLVGLMDDELREVAHSQLAPCSNDEFLSRYCELHFEYFGEEFIAEMDNPQW